MASTMSLLAVLTNVQCAVTIVRQGHGQGTQGVPKRFGANGWHQRCGSYLAEQDLQISLYWNFEALLKKYMDWA